MPEGLEIYVLAKVLKNIGIICKSAGKHLLIKDTLTGHLFDFSFGTHGRVKINYNKTLEKICIPNKPCGAVTQIETFDQVERVLGVDWMKLSKSDAVMLVKGWSGRKKMISALLVDQHEICGIGSFWVNIILGVAIIDPKTKSHMLEFLGLVEPLANALITVRDVVLKKYLNSIPPNEIEFVNCCFEKLYKLRAEIRLSDFNGQ